MNTIAIDSSLLLSLVATGCASTCLVAEGDRQVLVWNSEEPHACALVSRELFEEAALGDTGKPAEAALALEHSRQLTLELRSYRLCEAYGNGVLSADEYRRAVLLQESAR